MKYPILTICVLVLLSFTHVSNAIDQLKTDEDVILFWKNVVHMQPDLRFEHYHGKWRPAQVADSLGAKDWWITDIDNNGEKDLLIFRREGVADLTFFLSTHGNYTILNPSYASKYGLIYPTLKRINGKNAVLLFHQTQGEYDEVNDRFIYTPLLCDTLVCVSGQILNYNAKPRAHHLEKIIVENNGSCEGNCSKTVVTIDIPRLSSIAVKQEGWSGTTYRGMLDKKQIQAIVSLLNYTDFPRLDSRYRIRMFDETTTKLTVIYDGGKQKIVIDYGSSGTCSLTELYKLAYNVKWTLVH